MKTPFCLLLALAVAGCTTYRHPEPVQAKDAPSGGDERAEPDRPDFLPPSVQSELLQLNRPQQPMTIPEKRMRIAAHDVDAVEFFGSLFKGSCYSVAVHPGVAGVISVEPQRCDPAGGAGDRRRHVRLRRTAQRATCSTSIPPVCAPRPFRSTLPDDGPARSPVPR